MKKNVFGHQPNWQRTSSLYWKYYIILEVGFISLSWHICSTPFQTIALHTKFMSLFNLKLFPLSELNNSAKQLNLWIELRKQLQCRKWVWKTNFFLRQLRKIEKSMMFKKKQYEKSEVDQVQYLWNTTHNYRMYTILKKRILGMSNM